MARGVAWKGLASVAACAVVVAVAAVAGASVSLPVTWDALVRESTASVIVSPRESSAVWEGGRICTYTHVHVERALAGELATGGDAWVRTLGGVVGKVGQVVDGEAVFSPGRSSLVFLQPSGAGAFYVTARGQGQFPVVTGTDAAHSPTLTRSHSAGMVLEREALPLAASTSPSGAIAVAPVLATDVLHGRLVDDAARDVASAWTAAHAR
ncbi:MAG: hypothetical protein ACRENE_14080 [Polyangiaceae bacterium]